MVSVLESIYLDQEQCTNCKWSVCRDACGRRSKAKRVAEKVGYIVIEAAHAKFWICGNCYGSGYGFIYSIHERGIFGKVFESICYQPLWLQLYVRRVWMTLMAVGQLLHPIQQVLLSPCELTRIKNLTAKVLTRPKKSRMLCSQKYHLFSLHKSDASP